jgi:hypothetical protein
MHHGTIESVSIMTSELTIWRVKSGELVHHVVRYNTGMRSWLNVACWSPYGQLTAADVFEAREGDETMVTCLRCIASV